jgi:hypothetical protein
MLLRVMVEQPALPAIAAADVVKVQEARASRSTGLAETSATPTLAAVKEDLMKRMVTEHINEYLQYARQNRRRRISARTFTTFYTIPRKVKHTHTKTPTR